MVTFIKANLTIKTHFILLKSFESLKFQFPWRSYQHKLLKNFDTHIEDHHFHVIAPPGSGKTILGIEILRQIGKKTLVLAPTLTIRNQWENRLKIFFSENGEFQNVSFDIKSPSDITFSTYQSLHALYKSFENKKDYFGFFKSHNIETLVLDEAHHLKNAWWNCLMELKKQNTFFVVALTATPPYDSSRTEVTKYFQLCGEVDDEITVPELVRENDLSPHQDFIYFSEPFNSELNFIEEYRANIQDLKTRLLKDLDFKNVIETHRFYQNPSAYSDEIYSNTVFFSALLITLNSVGIFIDSEKLEPLGFKVYDVISFPKLDLEWLEVLLQNLLVTDRENLEAHEDYLLKLEKELRRIRVFDKNKVNLIGNEFLYKSLAFSPSKLESIVEIVNSERLSLADNLSCVILTDYVRKEFLNTASDAIDSINKIGVLPIFQYIRTSNVENADLAVLTGTIIIIHQSVISKLSALNDVQNYTYTPLKCDANFVQVNVSSSAKKSIVAHMTHLFEDGTIKVLVGTKALLGEGWDAPSINSLILASFVGSFVSSNQMRGRAIRKDASKPNKTSNIWHLACVDPTDNNGGREIELLKRRFEAFVGITNTSIPFIMNGYDRLALPENYGSNTIESLNNNTLEQASERPIIANKWANSIGEGTKLTRQIRLQNFDEEHLETERKFYYTKASQLVIIEILIAVLVFFSGTILTLVNWVISDKMLLGLKIVFTFIFLVLAHKLYKVLTFYLRHGFLHRKIKNIGLVILNTMNELEMLTTPMKSIRVHSEKLENGVTICNLKGATNYEDSLFTKALIETLESIDSPRYLIVKSNFMKKQLGVEQFYAVPDAFGKNKVDANLFYENWTLFMGKSRLVFTRQPKGRRLLLKARLFHHSKVFNDDLDTRTVWE